MRFAPDITCHTHEPHVPELSADTWIDRGGGVRRCSFCGSLSPEDLVELAKRPGVSVELADMKYGFPHKLYLHGVSLSCGPAKFYLKHLVEAGHDEEAFQAAAAVLLQVGIEVQREPLVRVKYKLLNR